MNTTTITLTPELEVIRTKMQPVFQKATPKQMNMLTDLVQAAIDKDIQKMVDVTKPATEEDCRVMHCILDEYIRLYKEQEETND